jgi:ABC-type nitrate/sulfonate/bicarbonate transport system permease component
MTTDTVTPGAATAPPAKLGALTLVIRVVKGVKRFTLLAVLLVLWQVVSAWWLPSIDPHLALLMPAPLKIVAAANELIRSGELLHHLLASLKRELLAFSMAIFAIPVGIAMGWWKAVNDQVDPVIEVLRPIPPLAWIPLSILWFGISDLQNQFIIFLGMVFPILINTVVAVKSVEPNLVRAARTLGASEGDILVKVVFKAALPQIITGVRVGLGVGWMALVAAELVGARSGLGFLISDARTLLRTDIIVVGMLTIGLAGLIIDQSIRFAARKLMPWSLGLSK